MERFVARYRPLITAVLSGFDRLVFRGTLLPLVMQGGMYTFLTRANVGLLDDKLLTSHVEYLALASEPASRHASYRGLFDVGDDAVLFTAIRDATLGGYAVVGDALKSQLAKQARRPLERLKPGRRPATTPEQDSIKRALGL